MGYIAYGAGTLIIAVVIHSLYKRSSDIAGDVVPISVGTGAISNPEREKLAPGRKEVITKPFVSIQISHDGDQDLVSSESEDSPPLSRQVTAGEVGRPESATITTEVDKPDAEHEPALVPALRAHQAVLMPPPPMLPPPPPRTRSPPRLKAATASSLAPSARGPAVRQGGFVKPSGLGPSLLSPPAAAASAARSGSLRAPPSSSLSVPQQRTLANTHMQPSLAPTTSTQAPSKRSSKKVLLSPGHSPLDWAALTQSTAPSAPTTLRGHDASDILGPHRLGRVTPSQLQRQTGRKGKDAWTSYQGRVYNISAYLDFHPGGLGELLRGAGRSSDALFAEVHPWVNWEGMLGGCLVGMLVSEDDPGAMGREIEQEESQNELDEMD